MRWSMSMNKYIDTDMVIKQLERLLDELPYDRHKEYLRCLNIYGEPESDVSEYEAEMISVAELTKLRDIYYLIAQIIFSGIESQHNDLKMNMR